MRLPILLFLVFLTVNLLVDIYLWRRIKKSGHIRGARAYAWSTAVMVCYAAVIAAFPKRGGDNGVLLTVMWLLFGYLSIYLPKYVITIFCLISSLPQLFGRRSLKWIAVTGYVAGGLLFVGMWWGALINRFNINVNEVTVDINGLPESFDGFRIAQISDLHVGTFGNDTAFVSTIVDKINSLKPDLIVFTGDIVNRHTDELIPFVMPLSRLTSPNGVISILGNHDYGDYHDWPDAASRDKNNANLAYLQNEMHWTLLKDSFITLHKGNDSIVVIGVENVGDKPFPVYGSLARAYPATSDSVPKILLSHNPAHWTDEIADNPRHNIALTLAGHTHAMQIELGGISPAALRYRTWGGMYADSDSTHLLYVNIGAGTVGFPARIGATPEIALFTLRPARR